MKENSGRRIPVSEPLFAWRTTTTARLADEKSGDEKSGVS